MSDPNEIALGKFMASAIANLVSATRAVLARVQSSTSAIKCKRGDSFESPLLHLVEAAGVRVLARTW
jgi:hypothetical protein